MNNISIVRRDTDAGNNSSRDGAGRGWRAAIGKIGSGRLSVRLPLMAGGLLVALTAAVAGTGYFVAKENILENELVRLQETAEGRAMELKSYLQSLTQDMRFMAENRMVVDATRAFTSAYQEAGDPAAIRQDYVTGNAYPAGERQKMDMAEGDTVTTYDRFHAYFHPGIRAFMEARGYYDVFIFSPEGDLVYSVVKENDYATNFVSGRWSGTGLANVFREAVNLPAGEFAFSDFAAYEPSNGEPAAFMATPVFQEGKLTGVMAVQMPMGTIQSVITRDADLGAHGEIVLVGEDTVYRSDSRLTEGDDMLKTRFDASVIATAIADRKMNTEITEASGEIIGVGAAAIDFEGANWVVVARAEEDEMLAWVTDLRDAFLLVGGIGLFVCLMLAVFGVRGLTRRIRALTDSVGRLAEGENGTEIPGMNKRDELGDVARGLTAIDGRNTETLRLKSALDNCATNVMVADTDYNIVYVNDTMLEMLRQAEGDIRQDLPKFDASSIVGTNIDVFHRDPSHQRRMLDALSSKHGTRLHIGGRHFDLVVSPVLGDNGVRVGTVVEWEDVTEKLARETIEREATQANLRIKSALDNTQTNVMVSDADLNIVYANDTLKEMLRAAEADIRTELPNFSAENIIGVNIDVFHKKPEHQRNMLARLNSTFRTGIEVGGRNFNLAVSPIKDDAGERVGFVVEWQDVTMERAIEVEIDSVVTAAVAGDFSQRIALEGKSGFMRNLAEAMNRLCTTTSDAVNAVAEALSGLAKGDLTRRVEGDYSGLFAKLRDDTNATSEQLSRIVTDITSAADEVAAAADEISSGTTDLSSRTEQQASNLEETAASMEEMAATIKQNAENAQQANQLSASARDVAMKGGSIVEQAIGAMSRIEDSSQKVSDIIGVIDEIAFQTNLLALNAAVEAARAGDAGKGFAVVASEVRTLAQRSSQAARDIKGLIVDSGSQVKDGVELVNNTGRSLEEIVDSIKRLSDIVSEISAASNEQATGVEEINRAVSQMDEMTQQNAALVEESAASAKTLLEQSQGMRQRMTYFHVDAGAVSAADLGLQAKAAFEARTDRQATSRAAAQVQRVAAGGGRAAAAVAVDAVDDGWEDF